MPNNDKLNINISLSSDKEKKLKDLYELKDKLEQNLSNKDKEFAHNYCECRMYTEAYMRTYPRSSYDSARKNVHKITEKNGMRTYIDVLIEIARINTNTDLEWVLEQQKKVLASAMNKTAKNGRKYIDEKNSTDAIRNIAMITQTINSSAVDNSIQKEIDDTSKQFLFAIKEDEDEQDGNN